MFLVGTETGAVDTSHFLSIYSIGDRWLPSSLEVFEGAEQVTQVKHIWEPLN